MTKYVGIEFEVTGRHDFPFDMLRYDGCWPARGEDAALLSTKHYTADQLIEPRRIRLRSSNLRSTPESARWSSFGWSVDPYSIRKF